MERLAIGVLASLVVVQGAYTFKLQRSVRSLTERFDQVAAPAAAEAPAVRAAVSAPRAPLPSLPRLTPAAAPAPMAAPIIEALGAPEVQQKLQEVLASMKEQRRQEKLVRSIDKREKVDQRMKELVGPELALNAEEAAQAGDILGRAMTARRHAIEGLQAGARSRAEAKSEIDGASKSADQALEKVLGEKRFQSYRELRKKTANADQAPAR